MVIIASYKCLSSFLDSDAKQIKVNIFLRKFHNILFTYVLNNFMSATASIHNWNRSENVHM